MLENVAGRFPRLAIVFVTHHVDEISPMFDRMLMLKRGRVFRSGATAGLVDSETVSGALDFPVEVVRREGRYWSMPSK